MDRRQFIQGLLVSAVGTEAIVKLATANETKLLTTNVPIVIGHPEPIYHMMDLSSPEVYMRRLSDGAFLPVGICTHFEVRTAIDEVIGTRGEAEFIPGIRKGRIYFEGQL